MNQQAGQPWFNPGNIPVQEDDFNPIPEGIYRCMVESVDVKENSTHTGQICKIQMGILGPVQAGRKLFDNFNLANPNPEAVRIGQEQLAKFCLACNGDARPVGHPHELLNKVVAVKVKHKREGDRVRENCYYMHESKMQNTLTGNAPAPQQSQNPWDQPPAGYQPQQQPPPPQQGYQQQPPQQQGYQPPPQQQPAPGPYYGAPQQQQPQYPQGQQYGQGQQPDKDLPF